MSANPAGDRPIEPGAPARPGRPLDSLAVCIFLALAAFSIMYHGLYVAARPSGGIVDFRPCYVAAIMALERAPVYDREAALPYWRTYGGWDEDEAWPFLYPLPALFLYVPLAFLPLAVAAKLWLAINILALAAILFTAGKLLKLDGRAPRFWVLVGVLMILPATAHTLHAGQANLLVLLLILLAAMDLRNGRDFRAGAAIAGACLLKITPAAFLIYPFVRGRWRCIAGWATTGAAAYAIASLLFGLDNALDLFPQLLEHRVEISGNRRNQSVAGLINAVSMLWPRLSGPAILPLLLSGAVLALTAAVIFLRRRNPDHDVTLGFATIAMAVLLASPKSLPHHFVLVFLVGAFIAGTWSRMAAPPPNRYLLVICLAGFMIRFDLIAPGEGLPAPVQLILGFPLVYLSLITWLLLVTSLLRREQGKREPLAAE